MAAATHHRILFVHAAPGIPLYGNSGGSRHLREVIRAMSRAGHEVTVVARRLVRRRGNPIVDLPCEVLHYPQGTFPGVLRRMPQVDETVYDHRLQRFCKVVAHRFRPTLVYERFSLFSAAGMRVAAELRIPGVLEVNAPLLQERRAHEGLDAGAWTRLRQRSILRTARRVIAVSSALEQQLILDGARQDRLRVIPNGVDTERFAPRPRSQDGAFPELEGAFVLGFCGSLKPWHDLGIVLEAMAGGVDRTALLVIGDGPGRPALERRAAALGLEARIAWAGERSEEDVPGLLARCDAVCVPCPSMEEYYFSPLKLLEGMAMGLPVVASEVGDIGTIAGGEAPAALLVPVGDVEAMAAAVMQLAGDPQLCARLGAAGRSRAQEHTWDEVLRHSLEAL